MFCWYHVQLAAFLFPLVQFQCYCYLTDIIIILLIYISIDENGNDEMEKIAKYFTLGQFKCPIVWSTRFSLHPRLQHSTSLLLNGGVQVLNTLLEKFSIRNRRNMFVYRESKSGSVFYLR